MRQNKWGKGYLEKYSCFRWVLTQPKSPYKVSRQRAVWVEALNMSRNERGQCRGDRGGFLSKGIALRKDSEGREGEHRDLEQWHMAAVRNKL